MVALHASGYAAPKGPGQHKRGIDSLPYTLGREWSDVANYVEQCSRLRGQALYERVGVASEEEVTELLQTAEQLRTDVLAWLKTNHADLLPPERTGT
jgi:hypothetical protein